MDIHLYKDRENWVCDFCNDKHPVKTYRAKDVIIFDDPDSPKIGSTGDWEACAECSRLIDANDREGLFNRSIHALMEQYPNASIIAKEGIKMVHDKFFKNRTYDP